MARCEARSMLHGVMWGKGSWTVEQHATCVRAGGVGAAGCVSCVRDGAAHGLSALLVSAWRRVRR